MSEIPTPPSADEILDVVDAGNRVIGQAPRSQVHARHLPHRSIHVLIYNSSGQFLLQHRSPRKETFPDCWESSCSGHVDAGEDYDTAARRELAEELGWKDSTVPMRLFLKIPASPETGMQFIQVYALGPIEGPFIPNPEEISEIRFASPEEIDSYLRNNPDYVARGLRYLWSRHRAELVRQLQSPPVMSVARAPVPPKSAKPFSLKQFGSWIGAGALLLVKFGVAILKFAKTGLSMLFMIVVYSQLFGWWFAAGFVLLIFVHEMGHVIAAKWLGMPVTAPLFIPFMGAVIFLKQNPRDAWTEALMAYGGPLAGAIGAGLCLAAGFLLDSPLLVAIAVATFVLNLFNMTPVPPLDGGRICAAVSTWFWLAGVVVLGLALMYFHSLTSIIIVVLVLLASRSRFKEAFRPSNEEQRRYYGITLGARIFMGSLYFGLIALMLLGYWIGHEALAPAMPDN